MTRESMSNDVDALYARLKHYIETSQKKTLDIDLADLPDKHLISDLEMDSLDMANFLFQVEEKEGVLIDESDLEARELYRLGKLVDYIQKQNAS